jgi:hypothetical protein
MSGCPGGIAVLGMGRSGTSAVAGMFVAAGFFAGLPSEVMEPSADNELGYYENLGVVNLNNALLDVGGGRWFDGPVAQPGASELADGGQRIDALLDRLVAQADGAPVAVKDPRIGLLMSYWASLIPDRLHPVLAVRDPIEVAQSLLRRDGTPIPFGLAAWELHMRSVLSALEGRTITVAPYEQLVTSAALAVRVVSTAAAHLNSGLGAAVDPDRASGAVRAGLRHNRALDSEHEQWMTARQLELWRLLEAWPAGDHAVELAAGSVLEPLTDAVAYERDRRHALERIAALGQELDATRQRAENSEAARIAAEGTLEAVRRSTSWRLTAPFRGVRSRRGA